MAKARWQRQTWTLSRVASLLAGLSKKGHTLRVSQIQKRYGVGIRELLGLTRRLGSLEDTGTTAWNYLDLRLDYDDQDRLVVGSTGAEALEALTRLSKEEVLVAAEALDGLALSKAKALRVKALAAKLRKAAGKEKVFRSVVYRPSENREEFHKLGLLSEAIDSRRVATFDYFAPAAQSRRRTVHPLLLRRDQGLWRLLAYDVDRDARRIFRVDAMRSVRVQEKTFELPADFDPSANLNRDLSRFTPRGGEEKVTVRMHPSVYSELKGAFDKKIKKGKKGEITATLLSRGAAWLNHFLLPFAGRVEITAPPEAARAWKEELQAIRKRYTKFSG